MASQVIAMNIAIEIAPSINSVVAALRDFGFWNAGTPLLMASTPVSAVVPDAKDLMTRNASAAEGGRGNSVIIASNEPIDVGALDRRRAAVGDDGAVVDDLTAFVAGAPLLTDDFAPVDQLIASGD